MPAACNLVDDVDDFILAIRLIDELMSPEDSTLWSVVLPKTKDNIGYLLTFEAFEKLIFDIPRFNLGLLSMLHQVATTTTSDGRGARRVL